jgi:rubrerythrin
MNKSLKKNVVRKLPSEQLQLLDTCQQIHKHAEELYLYLARIHQEHRDIARMWGLLAIDKCNHSDTFKMANRLKGDGIREITIAPETAANILAKMKTVPKVESQNSPSVAAALNFTVKMEENLSSVHFQTGVKFISERDTALMVSSLKSNGSILHMLTEEYLNLTILESEAF